MLCLRCSRVLGTPSGPSIVSRAAWNATHRSSAQRYTEFIPSQTSLLISSRTFTLLAPRRPTTVPISSRVTIEPSSTTVSTSISSATALDLLPKISTHPALASTQVRCGPRDTYSPSHFVRKRRHGFLSRIRTRKGRATLQRRKTKKRTSLSH